MASLGVEPLSDRVKTILQSLIQLIISPLLQIKTLISHQGSAIHYAPLLLIISVVINMMLYRRLNRQRNQLDASNFSTPSIPHPPLSHSIELISKIASTSAYPSVFVAANNAPSVVATEMDATTALEDQQLLDQLKSGNVHAHSIEKYFGSTERSVHVRRTFLELTSSSTPHPLAFDQIPFANIDYSKVVGACCENVIGYLPLPLGVAGPYLVDGHSLLIPMATTEGCLIASTSRGCKAISLSGGAVTVLLNDAMTRGPVLGFPNITAAAAFKSWMEGSGYTVVKEAFESTSRFARLQSVN